jgi:hypothetical protein
MSTHLFSSGSNDVVFNDVGRSHYIPWGFNDVEGNKHEKGKYWYIGYQDGVGFLLSKNNTPGEARFFVENGGVIPIFIEPWPFLMRNFLWILLGLLALIYILKRK